MKNLNIIVIPVYKEYMDVDEKISFARCCKILGNHPICIVTYPELQLDEYENIADKYHVCLQRENFDKRFFDGIEGYCELCVNPQFYKRFNGYLYMLIYQLDAYVFSDELDEWCTKGYDYIGAPFMELDRNSFWFWGLVGNGGFSLRKISKIRKVLRYRGPLYKPYYIFAKYYKRTLKTLLIAILHSLGYKNTQRWYIHSKDGDDIYYCHTLKHTWMELYVPSPYEASQFAIETHPEECYNAIGKLPFGCHAWHKYEYDSFWNKYINHESKCNISNI